MDLELIQNIIYKRINIGSTSAFDWRYQFKLNTPEIPLISVPVDLKDVEATEIEIWKTKVTRVDSRKEIGEWFLKYLNKISLQVTL